MLTDSGNNKPLTSAERRRLRRQHLQTNYQHQHQHEHQPTTEIPSHEPDLTNPWATFLPPKKQDPSASETIIHKRPRAKVTSDPDLQMTFYCTGNQEFENQLNRHRAHVQRLLLDTKQARKLGQINSMDLALRWCPKYKSNVPPLRCCLPIPLAKLQPNTKYNLCCLEVPILRPAIPGNISDTLVIGNEDEMGPVTFVINLQVFRLLVAPQDDYDPVEYIQSVKTRYKVNSKVSIIEPYLEIDACGRRIIKVNEPWGLLVVHRQPVLYANTEESFEIGDTFLHPGIAFHRNGKYEDAVVRYIKAFEAYTLIHKMLGTILGAVAMTVNDTNGNTTALTVVMVACPFNTLTYNDSPMAHISSQLFTASVHLEELGYMKAAIECNKESYNLAMRIPAATRTTSIEQISDNLKHLFDLTKRNSSLISGGTSVIESLQSFGIVYFHDWLEHDYKTALDPADSAKDNRLESNLEILFSKGCEYINTDENYKAALYCFASALVQLRLVAKIFFHMALAFSEMGGNTNSLWALQCIRTVLFWEPDNLEMILLGCRLTKELDIKNGFRIYQDHGLKFYPRSSKLVDFEEFKVNVKSIGGKNNGVAVTLLIPAYIILMSDIVIFGEKPEPLPETIRRLLQESALDITLNISNIKQSITNELASQQQKQTDIFKSEIDSLTNQVVRLEEKIRLSQSELRTANAANNLPRTPFAGDLEMEKTVHTIYGLWDDDTPPNTENFDLWETTHDNTYKLIIHNKTECDNLVSEKYPWLQHIYDAITPIERADLLRLLFIHTYGGIYADLDLKPKSNIEMALRKNGFNPKIHSLVAFTEVILEDDVNKGKSTRQNIRQSVPEINYRIANYIFYASRGSPVLLQIVYMVTQRLHRKLLMSKEQKGILDPFYAVIYSSGPDAMTEAVFGGPGLTVLPDVLVLDSDTSKMFLNAGWNGWKKAKPLNIKDEDKVEGISKDRKTETRA
ncbi:hypothetical protein HDU76_011972 [Blyttiomyces sp. JEL0837]|nr:hypothetical protein HDU76_011972 [Blyttiomyces sp. JEL0837]